MRTFIKLSSLAMLTGLMLAVGCGSDDDSSSNDGGAGGSGGSGGGAGGSAANTTGGSGGTNGDGGSGGGSANTTTAGDGGSGGSANGGSGGSDGTTTTSGTGGSAGGGSGGAPPDEAPYTNDDCIDGDGPTDAVTGSETGAFAEAADWHDGWANFSTDSSGVDCTGDLTVIEVESDGTLSDDTTLTAADSPYALEEKIWVADGQTLTIEPGVVVCAGTEGSVIVSRGGTIEAEGTADEPIIFTSAADEGDKQKGDWGGVILLGKARGFKEGNNVLVEGLDDEERNKYGGDEDDDNSGTLAYVRIEFGGTEISPNNEINGLTMGGIGSGTTIHHIEVNTSLDDCFEWFGGAVNADHLICNNAGDDMFDADQGFSGTLDTLLGISVEPQSSDPTGFEMDSDLGGAEPTTDITASNVTLCGTGEEGNALTYGMVLRELVEGTFSNIVVSGFDAAVDVRDPFGTEAEPHVTITDSTVFENLAFTIAYDETDSDPELPTTDDDNGFDERAWFTDGDGNAAY